MNDAAASDRGLVSKPRPSARKFLGPAVILLAALIAASPQFMRGYSCGHDLSYHFFSWVDAQLNWRQGILYPRWAPSPDYRAGEPRFIFYPPLESMAGAALGAVLPWNFVPIAETLLILFGVGLATRALALEAMDDAPATLAGCAAIFFGYALFTAYERTAFAELTGGIWIPLLALFLLRDRIPSAAAPSAPIPLTRISARTFDGSTALLALALAAAWLCDAPLGVMSSYFLAAMALLRALITKSWAPVIRAAAGAALGLSLAAVYLVPAIWEQRWVAINRTTGDADIRIQGSWLFARHPNPSLAFHDEVLHQVSIIVVSMVAFTLAGAFVAWLRRRLPGERKWWIPLALIPIAVLFLQLPVSLPVWNALPELHFMQFPWRWLVTLEAPMGIFFAAAVWPAEHRWRAGVLPLCAALFAIQAFWAGRFWFQPCYPEDTVAAMLSRFRTGAVLNDSGEFAPPGTDDDLLALGLPGACLVSNPAAALGEDSSDGTLAWNAAQGSCEAIYPMGAQPGKPEIEHRLIRANLRHHGYLVLRLRTYPAWRVRVNGKTVADLPQRGDGLMAVPAPQGPVEVAVDWTTTPDMLIGRLLSCLSGATIAGLYMFARKRAAPRLSLVRCLPT